jgi:hypothetical protein
LGPRRALPGPGERAQARIRGLAPGGAEASSRRL